MSHKIPDMGFNIDGNQEEALSVFIDLMQAGSEYDDALNHVAERFNLDNNCKSDVEFEWSKVRDMFMPPLVTV